MHNLYRKKKYPVTIDVNNLIHYFETDCPFILFFNNWKESKSESIKYAVSKVCCKYPDVFCAMTVWEFYKRKYKLEDDQEKYEVSVWKSGNKIHSFMEPTEVNITCLFEYVNEQILGPYYEQYLQILKFDKKQDILRNKIKTRILCNDIASINSKVGNKNVSENNNIPSYSENFLHSKSKKYVSNQRFLLDSLEEYKKLFLEMQNLHPNIHINKYTPFSNHFSTMSDRNRIYYQVSNKNSLVTFHHNSDQLGLISLHTNQMQEQHLKHFISKCMVNNISTELKQSSNNFKESEQYMPKSLTKNLNQKYITLKNHKKKIMELNDNNFKNPIFEHLNFNQGFMKTSKNNSTHISEKNISNSFSIQEDNTALSRISSKRKRKIPVKINQTTMLKDFENFSDFPDFKIKI